MKKVLFSIAIVVVIASMVSCGNKTAKGGDSDSTAVADSAVTAAPEEFWTTEAVEAQVRKMYDRLNDMDKTVSLISVGSKTNSVPAITSVCAMPSANP